MKEKEEREKRKEKWHMLVPSMRPKEQLQIDKKMESGGKGKCKMEDRGRTCSPDRRSKRSSLSSNRFPDPDSLSLKTNQSPKGKYSTSTFFL